MRGEGGGVPHLDTLANSITTYHLCEIFIGEDLYTHTYKYTNIIASTNEIIRYMSNDSVWTLNSEYWIKCGLIAHIYMN